MLANINTFSNCALYYLSTIIYIMTIYKTPGIAGKKRNSIFNRRRPNTLCITPTVLFQLPLINYIIFISIV